jgi:hypothetical protein
LVLVLPALVLIKLWIIHLVNCSVLRVNLKVQRDDST